MKYAIVEKKNHLNLHMICDYKERADYHLINTIPDYVARGYYMDKTLTADDFEAIEWQPRKGRK